MVSSVAMPARAAIGLPPNVAACMPGRRLGAISAVVEQGRARDAAAEALGERHDVGRDAEVLIGEPLAGPAAAGLHFVEDQQQVVLVGQLAQLGEEAVGRDADAAFALNRLDQDRRRFVVDQRGHGAEVAIRCVAEAGQQRADAFVVLRLGRGAGGAVGAAVEAALEGDDLVAVRPASAAGRA